jgi:hypothetical protein
MDTADRVAVWTEVEANCLNDSGQVLFLRFPRPTCLFEEIGPIVGNHFERRAGATRPRR